jgi:hypothetical protein
MRLRMMNHDYPSYDPSARSATWVAGLVGGAVGVLVMGAVWYLQTRAQTKPRTPRQLGWSRQGQAPSRAHIQLSSHVANQHHAGPR